MPHTGSLLLHPSTGNMTEGKSSAAEVFQDCSAHLPYTPEDGNSHITRPLTSQALPRKAPQPTATHKKRYSEIVMSPDLCLSSCVSYNVLGCLHTEPWPMSVLYRAHTTGSCLLHPSLLCTEDWTQACTCQGSYTLDRA